jgi:hypothetical protein
MRLHEYDAEVVILGERERHGCIRAVLPPLSDKLRRRVARPVVAIG